MTARSNARVQRHRDLAAAATKVLGVPELRNRIMYTYAGCRTPSATAILSATGHVDVFDAGRAAWDVCKCRYVRGHAWSVFMYALRREGYATLHEVDAYTQGFMIHAYYDAGWVSEVRGLLRGPAPE